MGRSSQPQSMSCRRESASRSALMRRMAGRDSITSHLYRVEALRGESAYLLRKYAPASAACRRPRPLATNASRLLNARALHRVRFSAVRGSVGAGHGRLRFDKHRICSGLGHCAENPRICFANPHRLRPPVGVLARGLKTLTRFLYARALHRVRFSAVRTINKKAGRYEYLPACYLWWRRGESNSGPRKPPDWHLQAQSLVLSRTLCAQRHARGVLTGSVLACAIPITCAGAFP